MKQTEKGFEFKVKNDLGQARIIGAQPLLLDRKPIPLENCSFVHDDHEAAFTDVSQDNSVLTRKGEALIVSIHDSRINRGRHSLGIHVVVKDMGPVRFTITDQLR